ncbi:hypothetical protein D3C73_1256990 [compost metagenome]
MLRFIPLLFGAAMNRQFAGTRLLNGIGDFKLPVAAVPAQAHFHRYRQMTRHRLAHRLRALIDKFRIFQ